MLSIFNRFVAWGAPPDLTTSQHGDCEVLPVRRRWVESVTSFKLAVMHVLDACKPAAVNKFLFQRADMAKLAGK
jgi:hypothetical protein